MTFTPVADAFVLLRMALDSAGVSQFISRPLGPEGVFAALDHSGGKHLLVQVDDEAITPEDKQSQGVHLVRIEVGGPDGTQEFLDLACLEPRLEMVFDRLVEDVLSRIDHGVESPVEAIRSALDDWRALLRRSTDLRVMTVIGLCGEFEVLRLLGRTNPRAALSSWNGPEHKVHDFSAGGDAIEVKATASLEGNSVSIHGLDQLDETTVHGDLYLAVAHCREDELAPSLDGRIDSLVAEGFPRSELISKAAQAGYVYEAPTSINTRYAVKSLKWWHVTGELPRMRRIDVPSAEKGLSAVQYQLNLDAAPPQLDEAEVWSLTTAWTEHEV